MLPLFYLFNFIVLATSKNTTLQLGCLLSNSPTGGRGGGSWVTAPWYAMKQAITEINSDPTILANYQLTLVCNYSQSSTEGAAAGGTWQVNHGSIAILGIGFTYEAIPLSYIASPTSLPLISFSATAASLHNDAYFPSFQRLIASDTSYTGILLSLCRHFGWSNLVVVYSTDDYGRSFNEDMIAIQQNSVAITYFPTPYTQDAAAKRAFFQTGQAIKKLDTRIVFMMTTPVQATLEAFYNVSGLLNSDFVFILNQDATTYLKSKTDIAKFVGGMLRLDVSAVNNSITNELATLPYYNLSQPNYVQNAYDSVYVVATALDALTNPQGPYSSKFPPLSNLTKQIRNTSFEGASGLIRFCGSDRLPLNWTISSMPIGGQVFQPVLSASTNPICQPQGSYAKYTITSLKTIVWSNGLTTVPIDRQPAQVVGLQVGTVGASLSLIIFGILIIFLAFILTNVNAHTRVIKGSSVFFCNLILFGVLIALGALLIEATYNRSDAYACTLVPGLLALSFDVTFGSLFAKTWRLQKIFKNAQHLKRSVITNAQVFLPVFALIIFDVLVMSLWSGLDLPTITLQPDPIRAYVLVQRCTMKFKTAWFSLLVVPKLGVLLYGMQISYQVRNIDKIFRESKSIAVAIIALFLCGAITTPVLILVWEQIDAAQILLTIGVTLSLVSVALVLFVPKFWKIYTGSQEQDLDKSSTVDTPNRSHSRKTEQTNSPGASVVEAVALKSYDNTQGGNSPTIEESPSFKNPTIPEEEPMSPSMEPSSPSGQVSLQVTSSIPEDLLQVTSSIPEEAASSIHEEESSSLQNSLQNSLQVAEATEKSTTSNGGPVEEFYVS